MSQSDPFDFWYAVNNTEVVQGPRQHLEAFGQTQVTYFLLSELMDSVNRIRVREGIIRAARPQIITPNQLGTLPLEGFDHAEARRYAAWLQQHAADLRLVQYGFSISKSEVNDNVVGEPMPQVVENVRRQLQTDQNPFSAIVVGVDEPWEVCLMKLMVDMVENSGPAHAQAFQQNALIPTESSGPTDQRSRIDRAFLEASRNANRIPDLHKMLQALDVFDEYEDRFFALVRASQSNG